MTRHSIHGLFGAFLRAALIAIAVAAPLIAVQGVRAGTSQFIGEAPSMSSGAGFVLMVSLQRS
ncbi:MAG: hypothetical protein JJ969_06220 [Rhizobiaceae bacterium]|jgi:hypothetical protein|nr:hypothetical protein [Rhizobiaceae bacterium]MBO6725711.1 hypothetical protein [Rhizobiaceae bacterium]